MKKAIAFLLCLCLFAAALPVCAESREAGGYTYDNSLILTVVTTSENPAEILTPNFLHGVTVAKKQLVDGGYKYDLICNFDGDFDEVVTELSQYSDIRSVSRNIYADDYFKGELGLKFNKDEIFVPLGGTADQFYTVKQEIMPELLTPYAVEIAVDPQKLDLSALSEEQLSALDITDMFYPEETGFEFYQNREYKVARYDNTVIKGGKSENGKYFLYVGLKNEIYNQEMLKKNISKTANLTFPHTSTDWLKTTALSPPRYFMTTESSEMIL